MGEKFVCLNRDAVGNLKRVDSKPCESPVALGNTQEVLSTCKSESPLQVGPTAGCRTSGPATRNFPGFYPGDVIVFIVHDDPWCAVEITAAPSTSTSHTMHVPTPFNGTAPAMTLKRQQLIERMPSPSDDNTAAMAEKARTAEKCPIHLHSDFSITASHRSCSNPDD